MRPMAHLGLLVMLLTRTMLPAASQDEILWHYRNLGKALYENRATQYDAVETFKKALDLAPDSAQERVNCGLALLRAGKKAAGMAELEQAQK
jgi:Tfp pilus assembly protein PilF